MHLNSLCLQWRWQHSCAQDDVNAVPGLRLQPWSRTRKKAAPVWYRCRLSIRSRGHDRLPGNRRGGM